MTKFWRQKEFLALKQTWEYKLEASGLRNAEKYPNAKAKKPLLDLLRVWYNNHKHLMCPLDVHIGYYYINGFSLRDIERKCLEVHGIKTNLWTVCMRARKMKFLMKSGKPYYQHRQPANANYPL